MSDNYSGFKRAISASEIHCKYQVREVNTFFTQVEVLIQPLYPGESHKVQAEMYSNCKSK